MPALQVFQYAVVTDANGERHIIGSMADPANLSQSFDGIVERRVYSLAASTTKLVWAGATSGSSVTAFSFAWIKANAEDVYLQLTTDGNNTYGDENYTVKLRKNLAFLLGSNASYANYVADFSSGTVDTIDEIWIRNTGSEDATVEILVAV